MADGLASLVEGYAKAQDLQMKKARELADQAANQWTQQFKVQQAKDAAAQQAIENQHHQEEIDIQKAAQDRLKEQAKETERKNKAAEDIKNLHENNIALIGLGKLDLADKNAADKMFTQYREAYRKEGRDPAQAGLMAQQSMLELQNYRSQKQPIIAQMLAAQEANAPQQQPASPWGAPAQSVAPQPSGNPIMDALRQRQYHGFNGPSETPEGMNQLGPAQSAALSLMGAKAAQAEAKASELDAIKEQIKANTALITAKVDTEKWKPVTAQATAEKIKQQTKDMKEKAARDAQKFQFDIAAEITNTALKAEEIKRVRAQTQKLQQEVSDLAGTGGVKLKDISEAQKVRHTVAANRNAMSDKARDAYEDVLKYKLIVDDYPEYSGGAPKRDKVYLDTPPGGQPKPYTRAQILSISQRMVAAQAAQEQYQREEQYLNHSLNEIDQKIAQSGKMQVNTQSGRIDVRADRANLEAINRDIRNSRAQTDGLTLPIPLRNAPQRSGPSAPKKSIEKKKGKVVYQQGGVTIREK